MSGATEIASAAELRDNARAIMQMVAFQEWQRQLKTQMDGRMAALLEPAGSMDAVLEEQYKKGEIVGLMHAMKQWEALIEFYDQEVKRKQAEEGDES